MAKRKQTVGSRELKTRLGTYLARVRKGETIVVTDRGEPVARLCPVEIPADPVEAAWQRMAAEGWVTLPTKKGPPPYFEPIKLKPGGLSSTEIIRQDRDGDY